MLILEDEPLIAWTLRDLIEEAGHEVAGPATSLSQALALCDDRRPDALFTNIHFGMAPAGIAATEIFLSNGIPSIFASGSAEEARSSRTSAIGFLSKPCSPEKLRAALSTLEVVLRGGFPGGAPAGFEIFEEGVARFHEVSRLRTNDTAALASMEPQASIDIPADPTMPNIILEDEDLRNVVAYMLSLEHDEQAGDSPT